MTDPNTPRLDRVLTGGGSTALVMIDLQRDILTEPFEPRDGGEIARAAGLLVAAVRETGGVVVHVCHDGRPFRSRPLLTDISYAGGTGEVAQVEFSEDTRPEPGEVIVRKRQWGAFYGTDLDQQLRARDVRTVVLCGVTTNFGVESTAREAFQRGYQLVFAVDAMGSVDAEHHAFSVEKVLPRIGCVTDVASVVAAVRRGGTTA